MNVFLKERVSRRYSVKKDVLKNFAKFTGKYLCQSLSFNKVAGLMLTASVLKRKDQCKAKIKLSADDPGFKSAKTSVIP